MDQKKLVRYIITAFIFFFLFTILTSTTFLTIDPGQKGVLFKRFGGGLNVEKVYSQGFHVVAPWNKMYIYDVRINEQFETMDVLSKNGLSITIELSYRYQPQWEKIGYLHNEIGTDYLNRIIKPEIRSATREVIGKYLPEELYSTKREAIQDEIFTTTTEATDSKHVLIDAVLIRSVVLPETLKNAIETKLEEEQLSFQYEFRLDRERKEAERKVIEAQAKADANRILNASLTNNILRDKGIEATLELAKSPNSKVVIVGGGEEGLPLILGGG
jgi:regulator of protease activity HflC (stomatin/prohibitin superfamily)